MLQLVLGVAGTGKTSWMLEKMKQQAEQGKNCIWLVPEQFSSSAEMMTYKILGDELGGTVEVLSFRTLAERIFKACGGLHAKVLTDAGRVVFVRRALDALGSDLRTFSRHKRNTAFCNMCAETISELKTAGANAAILREVAKTAQEPKMEEFALILEAYEALLEDTSADPEDRLLQAAERADCGYFDNKICFIDNFDGFTSPEYAMLGQIIKGCEMVFAALCCDQLQEIDGGMGLFSPVRKTAMRLLRQAEKAGVKTLASEVLHRLHRAETSGPKAVAELLNGAGRDEIEVENEGLYFTRAQDEWEEVALIAAEMRQLAAQGVPYSRMALVCRSIEEYESVVRRQFGTYEIPYFVDASTTIEYTAPIAFIRASLEILRRGINGKTLLQLAKTDLCGFTKSEISAFENYLYTWEREDVRTPFLSNPKGLLVTMDGEARALLAMAEKVRLGLVAGLASFIKGGKKQSAAVLSKKIYLLLDAFDGAENAEQLAQAMEERGEFFFAETSRRAWDLSMDLLDQMSLLLGEEEVTAAEYDDLFLLLVRSTEFGQAPQALESVIFTSADRMRLADPDYCFVAGVWEGEFPKQVGYSGIFTHTDREKLVEHGVEMPGSFQNRTLLEEMFFYRAMTSARKGLYISWPARQKGGAKTVSASAEPIQELFSPKSLQPSFEKMASTPKAAFNLLCQEYREDTAEAASIAAALQNRKTEWEDSAMALLEAIDNDGSFPVGDLSAIEAITGSSMTLSATRAERYYECNFAYFMERILGVRPRRKGEISPLESGTFVHYILEKVLEEAGAEFGQKQDIWLEEKAAQHADEFIAKNLPDNTKRATFLLNEIKQSVGKLLLFMRDAAAESDFAVNAVELGIGDLEKGVPPLSVTTPSGKEIHVTGKIDRVDTYQREGKTYLCIVDYKTGDKKFSLEDVYCGLNMQMLIYMKTLCQNAGEIYPDSVPAGVLYLTGDPMPASGKRQEVAGPVYKMDGLLLEDASILRSMDKNGTGIFLPVKYNKDGSIRAGKRFASLEKMGRIFSHVEDLLVRMAQGVYNGEFNAVPLVKGGRRPCEYCSYKAACRHEDGRNEKTVQAPEHVFEENGQEGETGDGGC